MTNSNQKNNIISVNNNKEILNYESVMAQVEQIMQLTDPALQMWKLEQIAKRANISSKKLQEIYFTKVNSSSKFVPVDIHDFLSLNPGEREWLIAGMISDATTLLLYADGGVGKTLLAYALCKAIATGQPWNEHLTQQGKVLIIQTDEPSIDTNERLNIAGFSDIPKGRISIETNWQFSQIRQLRQWIEYEKPAFVMIDSLTSANRNASVEEKDASYGSVLYELRDIANEFHCSIMVLHHENKGGSARGTTAILNNVSEVWHLQKGNKDEKLTDKQRILEIKKSRSGCNGRFLIELNEDDYSWHKQENTSQPQSKKERILAFLQERPGVQFTPEELASEFGGTVDSVRKILDRLKKSGQIQTEQREKTTGQGNRSKYNVYFYPDLSNSSKTLDTLRIELLDNLVDKPTPVKEFIQQIDQEAAELLDNQASVQEPEVLPDKDLKAVGQIDFETAPIQTKPELSDETTTPEQLVALLIECNTGNKVIAVMSRYPKELKDAAMSLLTANQVNKLYRLCEKRTVSK